MSRRYLTVTALTKYIKQKLDIDPHLQDVLLKGEISNFNHHQRGHMYMTIKDDESRVQAVMFAGNNRFLKFRPENGMSVLLRGNISVFEPYGQYQFYIKQMEPDGVGSLHLAFEQLKEKLSKQGYFSETAKKPLPPFPTEIGLITSPTGAAVKDMMTTLNRRYPSVNVTVIPAQVQGDGAAESIVKAIQLANRVEKFDLLIVGRGGGSIEDLWAFNEEIVAKAIFESIVPIISAVGHETDVTISDFVSDLRAPTPTAAAELAVPSQVELNDKLTHLTNQLTRNMSLMMTERRERLNNIGDTLRLQTPKRLVEQKEQQFDFQYDRLNKAIQIILNETKHQFTNVSLRFNQQKLNEKVVLMSEKIDQLTERNKQAMKQLYDKKLNEFIQNIDKITLVNPLNIMKRGYTITLSERDHIVTSSKQINENEQIKVKFYDGIATCLVKDVRREDDE